MSMNVKPITKHVITLCAVALVSSLGTIASAQVTTTTTKPAQLNWAQVMFSQLKHDFGNVAKGADARHTIQIKNVYEEDVRIMSATTTCGCTAAKPDRKLLKTGEVANIEVQMNTVKFSRQKNSNVDVAISFTDKRGITSTKTVRVPISAYIRPDVVIEPGGVNFGSVDIGAGGQQRVRVSYAGRSNWHIVGVESSNPYIKAEVVETSRTGGYNGLNGNVKYDLIVRISPEAPLGVIRDKVMLKTDDSTNPTVPVLVEAKVDPDIVVTPSIVTLGKNLKPGEERTYTVVMKGKKPFLIDKIECNSANECFKVRLSQDKKTVHVLPITFSTPDKPGAYEEEFSISVAGRPEPIVLKARGTIIATTTSTPAK